jgi:hypothetical protein
VGFGDSLSDPGNFYVVTGQQSVAPYAPIPSAPYAIGGHHFTNAATGWRDIDDSLIAIWFGANDVRDALTALSTASSSAELNAALEIIPAALRTTAPNIQALY